VEVEGSLGNQPELKARMLGTIASAYQGLGLYKIAEGLTRRELDVWTSLSGGKPNEATIKAKGVLAFELFRLGRFTEAAQTAQQAADEGQRVLDKNNLATLRALDSLAMVNSVQGKGDEAVALFRQVYEGRRLKAGAEASITRSAELNLGIALSRNKQYAESATTLRDLVAVLERLGPSEDSTRLRALASLAQVLNREKKYDESIAMYRRAMELSIKVLGPEHPDTLTVMNNFADALVDMGHAPEGEALARKTLAGRERVLGTDHPWTYTSRIVVADALLHEGKAAEAEAFLKPQLEGLRTKVGPRSAEYRVGLLYLGIAAAQTGRPEEALLLLGQAADAGAPPDDFTPEPLLDSLRADPRFQAIVARSEAHAKR